MMFHLEVYTDGLWKRSDSQPQQGQTVQEAIRLRTRYGVNTRVLNADGRVILYPRGEAPPGYEYTVKGWK